jgi:hypothetical protein
LFRKIVRLLIIFVFVIIIIHHLINQILSSVLGPINQNFLEGDLSDVQAGLSTFTVAETLIDE